MLRVAVADVPVAANPVTVTPVGNPPTPVAVARLVPVKVTGTEAPRTPLFGLMDERVGATTVNAPFSVLVPPLVARVTFLAVVGALAAMVKVAVTRLESTRVALDTVMPVLDTVTMGVPDKFVPVRVTGTTAPRTPWFGLIAVKVGAPTVNVKVLVRPADVVRVRVFAPGEAAPDMLRFAVT